MNPGLEYYKERRGDDFKIISSAILIARFHELCSFDNAFSYMTPTVVKAYLYDAYSQWMKAHPTSNGFCTSIFFSMLLIADVSDS
jgi:hypothetical protein